MSDILQQILDLTQGKAEAAEVFYYSAQDRPVQFENNRLKLLQTKATQGVALRVSCQGRLGFASATDLTRLEDLVTAALEAAAIGDRLEYEFASDFQASFPSNGPPPTPEESIAQGERLIAGVHHYNPEILVDVSFRSRRSTVKLATTNQVYAERSQHTFSTSLSGNLVQGEDFLQPYVFAVSQSQPDGDRLLEQLLQKYRDAERSATIASGQYPVLFTPRAATVLGRLLSTALSGRSVVQKASPLGDRQGEILFDERLTLYEDPHSGPAACAFDDEGTPTHQKVLIERGAVKEFYWDRLWAARGQVAPTGNGFRSGLSRPGPELVNLCLEPGETPLKSLIQSIDCGVVVDQVLGGGQSNQYAGEFSVNLDLGYKIHQGKIVGRLKNTMVAGNIFDAFQQLVALSQERDWVGSSYYLPSLLFANLGVASRR